MRIPRFRRRVFDLYLATALFDVSRPGTPPNEMNIAPEGSSEPPGIVI
jgi:hypothetical protein